MASPGKEAIFASEGQKTRMETNQVAVMFGDGGGEIIEPQLAGDATHESERVDMTANESFKALTVGELQIQLAAVTFHQTEGVEFSRLPLIGKRVEVSPVDLEAFSRPRFHAHVGARGAGQFAHPMQVLFQNAQTSAGKCPTEGKISTCAEAKLFLSRSRTLGPSNQTSETEGVRFKAKLFLTRRSTRRLWSRPRCR